MHTSATRDIRAHAVPSHSRLLSAMGATLLGILILYGAGFVQGSGGMVHNAAHDTRHSFGFPCH